MTKSKVLCFIATTMILMVSLLPAALCFGFLTSDPGAFVHKVFVLGIYGLLIGMVAFIWGLMEQ